jgi:hypothetical protein
MVINVPLFPRKVRIPMGSLLVQICVGMFLVVEYHEFWFVTLDFVGKEKKNVSIWDNEIN